MSDMSIKAVDTANTATSVNFGRRKHHNRNRQQCQNCNGQTSSPFAKMIEAGVAIGGGLFGKKMLAAPTADEIVLQIQNADNAKAYKKVSVIEGVVNALSKEGATLTDAHKEALKKVGVKEDEMSLETLKNLAKTKREAVESVDRGVISKKLNALTAYEKTEKALSEVTPDKQTKLSDVLEGMKKGIAKMFHLETDKDGKLIGEIDTKSLKATVEDQSKELSQKLIDAKKQVSEKLKDIKLLDANDSVAKAYKTIKDSKALKGYGALSAAILAGLAFLWPSKNNSSRKAA